MYSGGRLCEDPATRRVALRLAPYRSSSTYGWLPPVVARFKRSGKNFGQKVSEIVFKFLPIAFFQSEPRPNTVRTCAHCGATALRPADQTAKNAACSHQNSTTRLCLGFMSGTAETNFPSMIIEESRSISGGRRIAIRMMVIIIVDKVIVAVIIVRE